MLDGVLQLEIDIDAAPISVYTRFRSAPTPTSSVSISMGEASTTEAGTSEIHRAAGVEKNAVLEVESTSASSVHLHLCRSSATEASNLDVHGFAGADKCAVHTFEVIHFVPANRLSITKDRNYENVTRLSSITPAIEGRDLVNEQIGKAYNFIKDTALYLLRLPLSHDDTGHCLDNVLKRIFKIVFKNESQHD
nr:unnamed protein product [Spirometra erinaceieuropaei]